MPSTAESPLPRRSHEKISLNIVGQNLTQVAWNSKCVPVDLLGDRDIDPEESGYAESDIWNVVALLNRVIMAVGNHTAKKTLLLDGLATVISAESWAWTLSGVGDDRQPFILDFLNHGFTDLSFELYKNALPQIPRSSTGKIFDLQSGSKYPPTGWGSAIFFSTSIPQGGLSTTGFFRRIGAATFSSRETGLVKLMLSEIPWLQCQEWPSDFSRGAKDLSPRLATVLELLLRGYGRKQMANHLGISNNTIQGYVKSIYLHFRVNSHSALLQHCLHDRNAQLLSYVPATASRR